MSTVVCSQHGCTCIAFRAHQWNANKCRDCNHMQQIHSDAGSASQDSAATAHTVHVASKSSQPALSQMFRPPIGVPKRATAPAGMTPVASTQPNENTDTVRSCLSDSAIQEDTFREPLENTHTAPASSANDSNAPTSPVLQPASTSPPGGASGRFRPPPPKVRAPAAPTTATVAVSPPLRPRDADSPSPPPPPPPSTTSQLSPDPPVSSPAHPPILGSSTRSLEVVNENESMFDVITRMTGVSIGDAIAASTINREKRSASQATAPSSATPASATAAAAHLDLQKRFEVESNRRRTLETQVQEITKQLMKERKEHDALVEHSGEQEKQLQTKDAQLEEQQTLIHKLKQQLNALSQERAVLAGKVLELESRNGEEIHANKPISVPTSPTLRPASSSIAVHATDEIGVLQTRLAHIEALFRSERSERERLEIILEGLEIQEQRRTGSISELDVVTGNTVIDRRKDVAAAAQAQRKIEASTFDVPESLHTPSNLPRTTFHQQNSGSRFQRTIPEDLEGFTEEERTIRLKAGSVAFDTRIFAPATYRPREREQHTQMIPASQATTPSSHQSSQASSSSITSLSSPSSSQRTSSNTSASAASTTIAAARDPTDCVSIGELDAIAILDQFARRYRWMHEEHRAYFRLAVEEILEDAHDEEIVRQALKDLELDQIRPIDYELVEKLGEGGFGAVYKAVPRVPEGAASTAAGGGASIGVISPVAIKVLNMEDTEDMSIIMREVQTLGECNSCEQLTHYYASRMLGTRLWIVMELVDGGSVLDWLKRQKIEQDVATYGQPNLPIATLSALAAQYQLGMEEKYISIIVREVLLGLAYLEGQNKLHRDIKSANILLSRSTGAVKLADFGTARQLTDTMTKANTFLGSPYWMAPEIMQQEAYDGKADIWSLGITAYEMATGAPPHMGIHPIQVMNLITSSPPPMLEGERFSSSFKQFVSMCLVKEPEFRPTVQTLLKHSFVKKAKKIEKIKELFTPAKTTGTG